MQNHALICKFIRIWPVDKDLVTSLPFYTKKKYVIVLEIYSVVVFYKVNSS